MICTASCKSSDLSFGVGPAVLDASRCTCSMCRRISGLPTHVMSGSVALNTPLESLTGFRFSRHLLEHHFSLTRVSLAGPKTSLPSGLASKFVDLSSLDFSQNKANSSRQLGLSRPLSVPKPIRHKPSL